jgi:hypothetical protein
VELRSLRFSRFLLVFSEDYLENALVFSRCREEFIELVEFCEAIKADEGWKLAFSVDLKNSKEILRRVRRKHRKFTHVYAQKFEDFVSDVQRVVLQYRYQRFLHVARTQTAVIHPENLQKYPPETNKTEGNV